MNKNVIDVSIVIPAYNAEKTLVNCLASLFEQKTLAKFETTVINSSDQPYPTSFFQGDCREVFLGKRLGAGLARNLGASKSLGRLLLFMDADMIMPAGGLEFIYDFFVAGHDVFGTAFKIDSSRGTFLQKLEFFCMLNQQWTSRKVETRTWLPSGCLAVSRPIFESCGGFPDKPGYEDVEFTSKCLSKGHELFFLGSLTLTHVSYPTISILARKFLVFGKFGIESKLEKFALPKWVWLIISPALGMLKFVNIIRLNLKHAPFANKLEVLLMAPIILAFMPCWQLGALKGILSEKK